MSQITFEQAIAAIKKGDLFEVTVYWPTPDGITYLCRKNELINNHDKVTFSYTDGDRQYRMDFNEESFIEAQLEEQSLYVVSYQEVLIKSGNFYPEEDVIPMTTRIGAKIKVFKELDPFRHKQVYTMTFVDHKYTHIDCTQDFDALNNEISLFSWATKAESDELIKMVSRLKDSYAEDQEFDSVEYLFCSGTKVIVSCGLLF